MLASRQLTRDQCDLEIEGGKATLLGPLDVAVPMHGGVTEAIKLMGLIGDEATGREDGVGEYFSAESTFTGICAVRVLQG